MAVAPAPVTDSVYTSSSGSKSSRSRRSSIFVDLMFLMKRRSLNQPAMTESKENEAFMEGEEDDRALSREKILAKIREKKEVIEKLRCQPWSMKRKLRTLKLAQKYLERHEAKVSKTHLLKEEAARRCKKFRRWFKNISIYLIPWEARIKTIESHFGSVVSSYFTFLRWIFWVNFVMSLFMIFFIALPEILVDLGEEVQDDQELAIRKSLTDEQKKTATFIQTVWDFEGYLRVSAIFYGYYATRDSIGKLKYQLPLAYFLVYLVVLAYSFWAILRKMATNARLSKIASGKTEQYTFAWKAFTGWDFTIGNGETAANTIAANSNKFKESIVEFKVKDKAKLRVVQVVLRIIANILIVGMVACSTFAVYTVVQRSQNMPPDAGAFRRNEVPIVISLITLFFPNFFELVGKMETYHPRIQLRIHLFRILLLYLLNFYTLIFALFTKLNTITTQSELLESQSLEFWNWTSSAPTTLLGSVLYDRVARSASSFYDLSQQITPTTLTAGFIHGQNVPNLATAFPLPLVSLLYQYLLSQSDKNSSTIPRLLTFFGSSLRKTSDFRHSRTASADNRYIRSLKENSRRKSRQTHPPPPYANGQINYSVTGPFKFVTELPDLGAVGVDNANASVKENVSVDEQKREKDLEIIRLENDGDPTAPYVVGTPIPNKDLGKHGKSPGPDRPDSGDRTEGPGSPESDWKDQSSISTPTTLEIKDVIPPSKDPDGVTANGWIRTTPNWPGRPGGINGGQGNLDGTQGRPGGRPSETGGGPGGTQGGRPGGGPGGKQGGSPGGEPGGTQEGGPGTGRGWPGETQGGPGGTLGGGPGPGQGWPVDTQGGPGGIQGGPGGIQGGPGGIQGGPGGIQGGPGGIQGGPGGIQGGPGGTQGGGPGNGRGWPSETEAGPGGIQEEVPGGGRGWPGKTQGGPGGGQGKNEIPTPTITTFGPGYDTSKGKDGNKIKPPIWPGIIKVIVGTQSPPTPEIAQTLMGSFAKQKAGRSEMDCWETYIGQEICRLITMDLVMTIAAIIFIDFIRALWVRYCNRWWCWNIETGFPEYGEFKIAENVLHLVNNQGMIWLGVFFSPLLPAMNNVKLILLMYIRSWACMSCNVPAQQVFRASRSNNFYLLLLLLMLFLCTLPVGYVIASKIPSNGCGPFADKVRFYHIITHKIKANLGADMYKFLDHVASPGVILPVLILFILIIYFLISLSRALKESNEDLKKQLEQERTEEKRKIYAMAGGKKGQTMGGGPNMPITRKATTILPAKEQKRRENWRNKPMPRVENSSASLLEHEESSSSDSERSPMDSAHSRPDPMSGSVMTASYQSGVVHFVPSLQSLTEATETTATSVADDDSIEKLDHFSRASKSDSSMPKAPDESLDDISELPIAELSLDTPETPADIRDLITTFDSNGNIRGPAPSFPDTLNLITPRRKDNLTFEGPSAPATGSSRYDNATPHGVPIPGFVPAPLPDFTPHDLKRMISPTSSGEPSPDFTVNRQPTLHDYGDPLIQFSESETGTESEMEAFARDRGGGLPTIRENVPVYSTPSDWSSPSSPSLGRRSDSQIGAPRSAAPPYRAPAVKPTDLIPDFAPWPSPEDIKLRKVRKASASPPRTTESDGSPSGRRDPRRGLGSPSPHRRPKFRITALRDTTPPRSPEPYVLRQRSFPLTRSKSVEPHPTSSPVRVHKPMHRDDSGVASSSDGGLRSSEHSMGSLRRSEGSAGRSPFDPRMVHSVPRRTASKETMI